MKRRGPMLVFAGVAAAGLLSLSGSASLAQENIYENLTGLMLGGTVPDGSDAPIETGFTVAGTRLNPNGVGQFLIGAYYDVRPVGNDPQINNIQIINTNTNNDGLPDCDMGAADPGSDYMRGTDGAGCYNSNGGVLAKIRFRESKTSHEVLDFVVALSCGEVWAGKLSLAENGKPEIESRYPVVIPPFTDSGFQTAPKFDPKNGGKAQEFAPIANPVGITNADMQRGYFEVIAMESLPCEPISGNFSLDGGPWARIAGVPDAPGSTPTNALGGEIFLVRPLAAASHNYNLVALANFVEQGAGSIVPQGNPFADDEPNLRDCVNSDLSGPAYSPDDCIDQVNLALSKSRMIAQFDVDPLTAGTTDVIVTFPGKNENCVAIGGKWTGQKKLASTPFQCPVGGGEELVCTIYDRQENYFEEVDENFISPTPPEGDPCTLDREVNIINISIEGAAPFARADLSFATKNLPAPESGWIDLDFVRNADNAVIHQTEYANAETHDILGVYLAGFQGLPTLGLVLQEFKNPGAGRFYGNTVPALFEQVVLKASLS